MNKRIITHTAPGMRLIRGSSIMLVAYGFLGIMYNLISVNLLSNIDYWLPHFGGEPMRVWWHVYYITPIFVNTYAILIGILGVKDRENREKAQRLFKLGISYAATVIMTHAFAVIIGIYTYSQFTANNLFAIVINIIIAVIYTKGAMNNRGIKIRGLTRKERREITK